MYPFRVSHSHTSLSLSLCLSLDYIGRVRSPTVLSFPLILLY